MKNLWAWTFSLLLFLSLSLILWKINPQYVFGERQANQGIESEDSGEKLLLVLIEGLNETEFSTMLDQGELPHLSKLLNKNNRGIPMGVYIPLEAIVSEKEKPNFAPILRGVHPDTKNLSSVPDIYSYLKSFEYYKSAKLKTEAWDGFITENDPIATDFTRVINFLSYVTPELDYKLETYRSFNQGESAFISGSGGKVWQTYQIFKQRMASKQKINALPRFSFLNLKSPAQIGNREGITSEYRDNLKRVDQMLGSLFNILGKFKLDKNLNIMITSSYSRNSKLIGQNRTKVRLPLIVSGPALNYQATNQFCEEKDIHPSAIIHKQSLNLLRIKPNKSQEKGRSIASADDSINFWY